METLEKTKRSTDNFPALLQKFKMEVAKALPKHLNAERIARIALTSFRKNSRLGQCDPRGVFACVIMASQLGWEIGLGGQAFLVPYKDRKSGRYECQLIPGWQGLLTLVSNAGRATAWTGAVYDGDEFDYSLGDMPFLRHRPSGKPGGELQAVYAIGRLNNSQWPIIEVWPVFKLVEHRDRYNKVGEDHYSYDNFEMYGRKVALLQVLKYLPKSVELQTAIALENAAATGGQGLTYKEALDGTWMPESGEDGEEESAPLSTTEEVKEALKAKRAAGPLDPSGEDIWPRKQKPSEGKSA